MKKSILIIFFLISSTYFVLGQNIAITDDDGYIAHPSAILDVKAVNKGVLIPRLTTLQRQSISTPATGLMIFDSDLGSFYFYDGMEWQGMGIASDSIWATNPTSVYLYDTDRDVGVGSLNPGAKLDVKADTATGLNDVIFCVRNSSGDTILAVYEQGVRINIADDPALKATGSRGGFAVGGFSEVKGMTNEYLRVTPDSVRIYIDDTTTAKATGSRGGFAVGGFSVVKGQGQNYLKVTDDSTRIFVGDSTAGFGISNIQGASDASFLNLTTENYFIGHLSGDSINNGKYNLFVGYNSGLSNTDGNNNVFLGYKSGYHNSTGHSNIFIGESAGFSNLDGVTNVFIGKGTGLKNISGYENIFIGDYAGQYTTTGHSNSCIGRLAGAYNISGNYNSYFGLFSGVLNSNGSENTFYGANTGFNNNGSGNVFLGFNAGYNEAGSNKLYIENSDADPNFALIYGDFNDDMLNLNGKVNVRDIFSMKDISQILNTNESVDPLKSFIKVSGISSPILLNTSTAINDGQFVGQLLILQGISDELAVTVPDNANTNILNQIILGKDDTLMLIWNGIDWVEASRSDN